MAPKPTIQTAVHPVAHERLKALQRQLGSQSLTRKVDQTDMLSAMVLYTTPPQLAGMLLEYWRYIEMRTTADERGDAPPPPPAVWP
jgi:hypothetical protein